MSSQHNAEIVLLPSLNSTADRTSTVFVNKDYVSGHLVVDITARSSTDAGPVVTLQGMVPGTTGTYYTLLASTAVGTSSTSDTYTQVMHVAPWVSTSANNRASLALPKRFRAITTYASTENITYSVGINLA